jgi:hypothetical protein
MLAPQSSILDGCSTRFLKPSTGWGNSYLIGCLRSDPRRFKPDSAWFAGVGTRRTATIGTGAASCLRFRRSRFRPPARSGYLIDPSRHPPPLAKAQGSCCHSNQLRQRQETIARCRTGEGHSPLWKVSELDLAWTCGCLITPSQRHPFSTILKGGHDSFELLDS